MFVQYIWFVFDQLPIYIYLLFFFLIKYMLMCIESLMVFIYLISLLPNIYPPPLQHQLDLQVLAIAL